ncbi:MAG: hypothetical protein U0V73_10565 [Acidimicrobiia bacterium]
MTATGTNPDVYGDEGKGFGWLFFAGTILGLAGLMRILDSIWAFRHKGSLPDDSGVLGQSLTHYAWAWLIVGIILIVSSFAILSRNQFARWIGFIAATIGGLSAMTWMPYYPIWSMTYVLIAVLVFYALARYGGHETV